MLQNALICTDLMDGLQRLVKFVDSLAGGGLKEITFFHNVPLWEEGSIPRVNINKVEEITEILQSNLGSVPTDVKVNIEVSSGEVVDNIVKTVDKYQADFIIKGVPFRKAWQEKILSSTTLQLNKRINIPVMIFRPQLISVYREDELALRCQNLNRFWLIPYNDSATARYLITKIKESVMQKATDLKQQCLLLTVVEDTARSQILVDNNFNQAQEKLMEVKADLEKIGLEVETLVVKGNPFLETNKVAIEYDISTIAIADDKDHGILNWTVPSYAHEILYRSWFPLLYFPIVK